jgi:Molybdopterin-binding domain of aldehyde dehydrogenase
MRDPGEATGLLALECAMDELAEKLESDPIELRMRNEPTEDPEKAHSIFQPPPDTLLPGRSAPVWMGPAESKARPVAGRRGELVDSGAEPRPQRRSRCQIAATMTVAPSSPTTEASRPRATSKLDCVEHRLVALRHSTVVEPQVALFRGHALSFDTLGDTIADRLVDVPPIFECA